MKNRMTVGLLILAATSLLASAPAIAQPSKSNDGDRLTNDVWVRLTLKNGAQVEGMATGGVAYERLDKGKFVAAKPETHRDAGLRLHFVDYNEGFLFIRARDVQSIDSEKTLTAAEQTQIRSLVKKRQETVSSTAAAAASAASGGGASKGGVPGAPAALAPSADQLRKQIFAKFPPGDGWGPAKRDEILKKRWTVGVFPDALEREFLDNYENWMTEYQSALDEDAPKKEGDAPPPAPLPPQPPGSGEGARDAKDMDIGENAGKHGGAKRDGDSGERKRGE